MENYATKIYVINDEILNIIGLQDDPQSQIPRYLKHVQSKVF